MDDPLAAFDDHQYRAIALLDHWIGQLEPGMCASQVLSIPQEAAPRFGFDRALHPPVALRNDQPLRRRERLRGREWTLGTGDRLFVHLAPGSRHAFAEIGLTLLLTESGPTAGRRLEAAATRSTRAACRRALESAAPSSADILGAARAGLVREQGVELAPMRMHGHRLMPPRGPYRALYPRLVRPGLRRLRHQVRADNPTLLRGVFTLRPTPTDGRWRAATQECVAIQPSGGRILGRDSLADVGCFRALRA